MHAVWPSRWRESWPQQFSRTVVVSGLTCLASRCLGTCSETGSAKEHRHRFIAGRRELANESQVEYAPVKRNSVVSLP